MYHQVSGQADSCVNCGYPIRDVLVQKKGKRRPLPDGPNGPYQPRATSQGQVNLAHSHLLPILGGIAILYGLIDGMILMVR